MFPLVVIYICYSLNMRRPEAAYVIPAQNRPGLPGTSGEDLWNFEQKVRIYGILNKK